MQCLHPVQIKDPRFEKQYPIRYLTVPCNRCMPCRINKTAEWSVRILYESTKFEHSTFLTLTYDDEYLKDPSLSVEDWQKFMKRLRKHFPGKTFKYYACGEYGPSTMRKHMHAIVLGLWFDDWKEISTKPGHFTSPTLSKLWPFGFNEVGFVNETTMNYVTGYIQKKQYGETAKEVYEAKGLKPPFQLFSKGLGLDFAMEHAGSIKANMFVVQSGRKKPVPKYISKKIGLDQSPTPFKSDSPLVQKAVANARQRLVDFEKMNSKRKDKYVDYEHYQMDVRAQRENEFNAKKALFNLRDKI